MILCVFIGASVDADGVGVDGLIGALVCAHTGAAITRAAARAVPLNRCFMISIFRDIIGQNTLTEWRSIGARERLIRSFVPAAPNT